MPLLLFTPIKDDCLRTKKGVRTFAIRAINLGLLLALVLLVSRNVVSRFLAERVASSLLATEVRVESVHIGLGTIQVDGITVMEPSIPDAAQIEVHQVDVVASIFRGLSDGKWVDHIAVVKPVLHLRFDDEGQLLSVFPKSESSSEGETKIPLRSLLVQNAELIVHQGTHCQAMVEGASLSAAFGTEIDLRAEVDQLLDGQLDFQTRVDAATFAGSTVIQLTGCRLDSHTLPASLLPPDVRKERVSGTASMLVKVQHPADEKDFRHHPAEMQLRLQDIAWSDFGTVVSQVTLHANTSRDGLALNVDADPLQGRAQLSLTTNSLAAPLTANMTSEVSGCDLQPLLAHFIPNFGVHATAGFSTHSQVSWHDGVADFQNTIHAMASGLAADDIELDPVICDVICKGQIPLDPNNFDPMGGLQGNLSGNVTSDGLGLHQLAKRLGIADLDGRLQTSVAFSLPLDQCLDPNALTVEATASCENIQAHGVALNDTVAQMSLSKGTAVARLDEARFVSAQGETIAVTSGSAQTSLSTRRLQLQAILNELDGQHAARLCKVDDGQLRGKATGQVDASVSLDSMAHPDAWQVLASLNTVGISVLGEVVRDVNAQLELNQGRIVVAPTTLQWRENRCQLSLDGKLTNELTIDADFSAGPISLRDVADVASRFSSTPLPLAGTAQLAGKLHADSKRHTITTTGTASLSDATYARTSIGSARLNWKADSTGLVIHTGSDDLLGGQYTLSLTTHQLDWTQSTIESWFTGIQANRLPRFANVQIPVTGTLEGGFKFTSLGSLAKLGGNAWVRSRALSAMNVPIELTRAEIQIENGMANGNANGELLQGTFDAKVQSDLQELVAFANQDATDLRQIPFFVEAKLSRLSIDKAIQAAKLPTALRPLSGFVDANCTRDANSIRDGLLCTATASAERVRWNQSRLSDRVTANVELRPDRLALESVDGRFADGRLSGRAEVSLIGEPRGTFQFGINRMNLRLAAAPLGNIASGASGTASVRVTGRIAQTISGRADVSANNPSIADLNIRAVRFPIDWTVTPASNRIAWRCRAGVIEAGGGKINVSTEGDYSRSLNMQLAARLNQIDTSRLLRGKSVGAGVMDGQVHLNARRASRPDQISGNFDLQMSQVDSLEMPILDQLDSLVSLTPSLGSKHDNDGTITGRLSGGLVHLDQLAITQSNVQVLMSGNASLDGRLNFDVTAATGQVGPADGLMALTDSPLMLAAPAPVTLVLKANEAMKDRVVHVHVGGTSSRPTLRLQPGKNLTQDTLRFFLTNSFGSQVANVADQSRNQNRSR
ncbi:AsmA-like C-terminal region-containing protein [Rhodopirellula islandica]|uniref:AsmA-like C-terminal region-containing protein n=1 Tax=Rhodopirellula islandica TaxID=595434 RepID=UPI001364CE1E|nr:AsmA-like C-terminal region-containing protein [Rhodopirellula islandica]